jgi:tetratricopeptide (TPR) repeat protein
MTLYFRERQALVEQARLSRETEASREAEARLRREAQARANVSRVALMLSAGQVPEADALLRENPLVSIEPSLEAASVFRALGDWNATYGRWDQAVQCYLQLNQANRLEDPAKIVWGTDLLAIGPALLEGGDTKEYRAFRDEALRRYLPIRNPLQAEHFLKACLLVPAEPTIVARLKDAADICQGALERPNEPNFFPGWGLFSLTLFHLRDGDDKATLEMGERCLQLPESKDACRAAARSLMAIACCHLGRRDEAKEHVRVACSIVDSVAKSETGELKPSRPFWFDWSTAAILIKEAEEELEKTK